MSLQTKDKLNLLVQNMRDLDEVSNELFREIDRKKKSWKLI